jgi:hypothetical protein
VFTERDLVEREEKNNKVLALLRKKSKTKVRLLYLLYYILYLLYEEDKVET